MPAGPMMPTAAMDARALYGDAERLALAGDLAAAVSAYRAAEEQVFPSDLWGGVFLARQAAEEAIMACPAPAPAPRPNPWGEATEALRLQVERLHQENREAWQHLPSRIIDLLAQAAWSRTLPRTVANEATQAWAQYHLHANRAAADVALTARRVGMAQDALREARESGNYHAVWARTSALRDAEAGLLSALVAANGDV